MQQEYNGRLCDERHENLAANIEEIKKDIKMLYARLNWFYIICLITLGSSLANLVVSKAEGNDKVKQSNISASDTTLICAKDK